MIETRVCPPENQLAVPTGNIIHSYYKHKISCIRWQCKNQYYNRKKWQPSTTWTTTKVCRIQAGWWCNKQWNTRSTPKANKSTTLKERSTILGTRSNRKHTLAIQHKTGATIKGLQARQHKRHKPPATTLEHREWGWEGAWDATQTTRKAERFLEALPWPLIYSLQEIMHLLHF
jgi:hypothetical protein